VKGFILCDTGIVSEEWIDDNGHMNVTAYMRLFDRGTNLLLDRFVTSIYSADLTIVASRIMLEHRRELLQGDSWELWSGVISVTSTYVTLTHRLRSTKSIHAVCHIRGVLFSIETRQSLQFEAKHVNKLSKFIIHGLVDRFNVVSMQNRNKE